MNVKLPRIVLSKNIYFGGALNYAFEYVLKNRDKYDSLMFLNSDLIIHGMNFVKTLRYTMFHEKFKIISPAIINAEFSQCHWKQMYNWNYQYTREVKWIDFQAPLFHIDFIKRQEQYPHELILGWGNDIISGINCEQWNMNIGVVDKCTITHLNNQTVKKNETSNDYILSNYNKIAEMKLFNFIQESDITLQNKFTEYRQWGTKYII